MTNLHTGIAFQDLVREFFVRQGVALQSDFSVSIGVSTTKRPHKFDLGSDKPPILVECKAHTWTESGNIPSAKLTIWNEAMYYFHLAPAHFRKILFVCRSVRRSEALADHYAKRFPHLIPSGVEIWEMDLATRDAHRVPATSA